MEVRLLLGDFDFFGELEEEEVDMQAQFGLRRGVELLLVIFGIDQRRE